MTKRTAEEVLQHTFKALDQMIDQKNGRKERTSKKPRSSYPSLNKRSSVRKEKEIIKEYGRQE